MNVRIPLDDDVLDGELVIPRSAIGVVLFAHGSGSSRSSPRNQAVARTFENAGIGTLLFDLLTPREERVDRRTAHLRFDIPLLARRLVHATHWVDRRSEARGLPRGYFGASTGAAAALLAAADRPALVSAIVSRGGRPDLAGRALARVSAPTLLIVGGLDTTVLELNEWALERLKCAKRLEVVAGATHLFEEPRALEAVAELATAWFVQHLSGAETYTQPRV